MKQSCNCKHLWHYCVQPRARTGEGVERKWEGGRREGERNRTISGEVLHIYPASILFKHYHACEPVVLNIACWHSACLFVCPSAWSYFLCSVWSSPRGPSCRQQGGVQLLGGAVCLKLPLLQPDESCMLFTGGQRSVCSQAQFINILSKFCNMFKGIFNIALI